MTTLPRSLGRRLCDDLRHRLHTLTMAGARRSLAAGLAATLSVTLAACGGGGGGSSTTTTASVAAVTVALAATPTSITLGQSASLTWSTANATSGSTCTASGSWSGTKATSGTESVTPTATGTSTYTLVCSGVTSSATVTVTANPSVFLSASPTRTTAGKVIALTWATSNVASGANCTASGAWSGSKSVNSAGRGSESVVAGSAGTYAYTLTCGGVASTANVTVTAAAATLPTVSMAFAPSSITTLETSVLTWSSTNTTACTASGAWSGSQALSGTLSVPQTTAGTYTYTLTCTGAGGTATAGATLTVTTAASTSNTAALLVDNGPSAAANGAINVPFVSVTVCQPGTTTCQTIDHVLVDTGSYGLRLIGPLSISLGAVSAPSGSPTGECAQFVSGYAWGAVKLADVKIGGETASSVSVHVVGDTTSSFASAPSSCTSTGTNLATVTALGANGILGIGLFQQDCGSACVNSAIAGTYYSCVDATCTASKMPLANQVSNPVASFAVNNNGVILVLPSVPTGGATSLTGSLIFGVGTQTNNALGSETVYKASSSGYFTTTYTSIAGVTGSYPKSFIDSGSNGYFFNDSSIPNCSSGSGFFCPTSTLSLSATNAGYDGSASGTVAFTIESVNSLKSTTTAASIGGSFSSAAGTTNSTSTGVFDWGLPFFFGRKMFVVYDKAVTSGGTGPYWAY